MENTYLPNELLEKIVDIIISRFLIFLQHVDEKMKHKNIKYTLTELHQVSYSLVHLDKTWLAIMDTCTFFRTIGFKQLIQHGSEFKNILFFVFQKKLVLYNKWFYNTKSNSKTLLCVVGHVPITKCVLEFKSNIDIDKFIYRFYVPTNIVYNNLILEITNNGAYYYSRGWKTNVYKSWMIWSFCVDLAIVERNRNKYIPCKSCQFSNPIFKIFDRNNVNNTNTNTMQIFIAETIVTLESLYKAKPIFMKIIKNADHLDIDPIKDLLKQKECIFINHFQRTFKSTDAIKVNNNTKY